MPGNSETTSRSDPEGFAQALALILETRGLSQGDLAKASGVSASTVSNWLSGRTGRLQTENLFRVEDVLGVPRGTLSRYFGFISTTNGDDAGNDGVEGAILRDPLLWPEARQALLAQYRVLVGRSPKRGGP